MIDNIRLRNTIVFLLKALPSCGPKWNLLSLCVNSQWFRKWSIQGYKLGEINSHAEKTSYFCLLGTYGFLVLYAVLIWDHPCRIGNHKKWSVPRQIHTWVQWRLFHNLQLSERAAPVFHCVPSNSLLQKRSHLSDWGIGECHWRFFSLPRQTGLEMLSH